jgi:hypothetical protein
MVQMALPSLVGRHPLRQRKPAAPVMLLMSLRSHVAETQTSQKRFLLEVNVTPSVSQPVRVRQLAR